MSDRTVHAVTRNGWEIVRYDIAGKWYCEKDGEERHLLTLEEAVLSVIESNDRVFYGLPGGKQFDAWVRRSRTDTQGAPSPH